MLGYKRGELEMSLAKKFFFAFRRKSSVALTVLFLLVTGNTYSPGGP